MTSEDIPEGIVEFWDNNVHFNSVATLRAFLATRCDIELAVRIGECFARAGRAAEAMAVAEHLQNFFYPTTHLASRESIANGLVSIGGYLLDQGLRQEAITVLAATASLLRGEAALRVCEVGAILEQGVALKEEAYASNNAALMREAVALFSGIEERFEPNEAPVERVVAKSTYSKAGALGWLRRNDEARDAFASVARRYRESRDPELQNLAAYAAVRERMMLAVPDPPPYIRERGEPFAKAALESHRQAADVLVQHRVAATPFALFLRSFDVEAVSYVTQSAFSEETGLGPHVVTYASVHPHRVEKELVRALADCSHVLGVANQFSRFEAAWIVPRLFLPEEGWKEVLEALIRQAYVIVVQAKALTPGLRWELECIRSLERSCSTLVVLANPDDDRDEDAFRKALRLFAAVEQREIEPVAKEAAELSGFTRVIYQDEIPDAGLAANPFFADLLEDMKAIATLDAEARVRRYAAAYAGGFLTP